MSNSQIYVMLLHTHKLVVILFLLHYLIKTVLLVLNKQEALAKYSKPTKVPEMIISSLFLITGVVMLVMGAQVTTLLLVKIVLVFAAIPLAVIAFKKGNKGLAILSILCVIASYGLAEANRSKRGKVTVDTTAEAGNSLAIGKKVYTEACAACHGDTGNAGLAGAKDLTTSTLNHEEVLSIIQTGKNSMPAYKKLTTEQIEGVAQYVESLRANKQAEPASAE
ncbi:MAG: SirB2 family protein [Chitinophagales bacterium]|nr:SirB2 family protein [Chitinophagales bacterium]MCO5280031.1 SirB2 family protein [Chitinophagales bacterium]OJV28336.1 MAG: hypothetical protein BGO32_05760 [Bacteroidetes bacterium 37-13]HRN93354.1 SirB2 family protein [Chitinophagales bacterium]HRP38674.1 SirB2 family protein [Chitinophagales bacterium]